MKNENKINLNLCILFLRKTKQFKIKMNKMVNGG